MDLSLSDTSAGTQRSRRLVWTSTVLLLTALLTALLTLPAAATAAAAAPVRATVGATSTLTATDSTTPSAPAPDDEDPDEDALVEQALAEMYAPVMMLVDQPEACGPGEPYVPRAVDPLFDESSIALRGPWTSRDLVAVGPSVEDLSQGLRGYSLDQPGDPLRPGCDYEKWAARLWGSSPEPAIYARVATQAGVTDRVALQYFFYYPFNDYNNKHESDWERIQVEFPAADAAAALDTEPDLVVYAQHYGSERAGWEDDKLQREDFTHPVVYVSAGSHASQFEEGLYLGRSSTEGFGCDTTIGPHDVVRPTVLVIPSDPEAAAEAFPWTTYQGSWGELGPRRFYEGPTGPNMKQAWTKPFTWSANARDTSFSLPGVEVAGSSAAESFCTLVASGSDAFRAFSADPTPVLGVLLGVVLLLVWLVHRAGWATSTALPLVTGRRPAPLVASALRMLRTHRWLFLRIATPSAVLSALSSLLTATATGPTPWRSVLSAVLLLGLVASLVWAQLATAQAVRDIDAGLEPRLRSLAPATGRRTGAAVGTLLLWAAVTVPLLLSAVLTPVGLVVLWAWSLVLPVVQLEGRAGPRALARSWRLVRSQKLTVLMALLVSALLLSTLGGVMAALVFIVSPAPFVVVSAVPQLVTTLVWPVTALLTTYAWANGVAREQEAAGYGEDGRLEGQDPVPVG